MSGESTRATRRPARARRIGFALTAAVLATVLTLLLAEGAARVYVYYVAERGKLFRPHAELGWVLLPDLDLSRKDHDGTRWHVRTSARGFRSIDDDFGTEDRRRVLVLGDSFAFGQGVSLEDRFDTLLAAAHPDWSILNQGVMGYGTDQQLIAARADIARLREGDLLVIVSYLNDFVDLLRKSHSGRAKPWFELADGELIEHPAEVGFAESVRDQSYLLARLFQELAEAKAAPTPAEHRTSGHLYRRIVEQETADPISRGVQVLIAYHGSPVLSRARDRTLERAAEIAFTRLCGKPEIDCVSIDLALKASKTPVFQPDGHWNAAGNAIAAAAIERALANADR